MCENSSALRYDEFEIVNALRGNNSMNDSFSPLIKHGR